MHKTRVDRRYEKFFGTTIPSPPKAVKRRGRHWVTDISGKLCYYGSTSYHLLDEVKEWLDARTLDWYVTRSEDEYDWTAPKLRLHMPSLELITEFRLSWCDYNI
jgi:hypothetical protein